MLAATDLITAEVVNLAVLRLAVLASTLEQGRCSNSPSGARGLREDGLMRGTDVEVRDPSLARRRRAQARAH